MKYKTGRNLAQIYMKMKKMNGSLLLNLGPDEIGNLDVNEVYSLLEMKKYL